MARTLAIFLLILAAASLAGDSSAPRTTIAVLDLKAHEGLTAKEGQAISDVLRGELVKSETFTVLDRSAMQDILKEQSFSQSGACDEASCLVEVGKLLSVQKMVSGSIGKLGSGYSVTLRLIDVQTGVIEKQVIKDATGSIETVVDHDIRNAARELAGLPPLRKPRKFKAWYIAVPGVAVVGAGVAIVAVVLGRSKDDGPGGSGTPVDPSTDVSIPVIITVEQ